MENPLLFIMKDRRKYHLDIPLFLSVIPFNNAINYYRANAGIQPKGPSTMVLSLITQCKIINHQAGY